MIAFYHNRNKKQRDPMTLECGYRLVVTKVKELPVCLFRRFPHRLKSKPYKALGLRSSQIYCKFEHCLQFSKFTVTIYEVRISTRDSTANFDVYLNIIGTKGDIGFRKLFNEENNLFQPDAVIFADFDHSWAIPASRLGKLRPPFLELRVEPQ